MIWVQNVQSITLSEIVPTAGASQIFLKIYHFGGRERSAQGAGGETRGEETAGETKA